ncbi:MAG: murein biosynthesis integral membrane protein MurJ, partial [Spirochaetaceae bacterium]|nr:murein biosynthesis integral membrane protein MurJ [Spirochaetaceae bacterium]
LFVLLLRKKDVDSKHISLSSGLYALKIAVFSIIAAVPVYFAREPLLNFFEGHNRWISYGCPVAVSGIIFAIVGVILLLATKDPIISPLVKKVAKR